MRWQVLRLDEFDADVADVSRRHGLTREAILADALRPFTDPYHAARLDQLLAAGTPSPRLDRLVASEYPPSVRLHVLHDLRATAWLFPTQRHGVLVHLFHKSSDPNYKRAAKEHDARLGGYFLSFRDFVERKRKS